MIKFSANTINYNSFFSGVFDVCRMAVTPFEHRDIYRSNNCVSYTSGVDIFIMLQFEMSRKSTKFQVIIRVVLLLQNYSYGRQSRY